MADNTTLDPGVGGDTIRDVDRAGTKTQVVALDLNPAGAESLMAGALPVTDNAGSLTVDNPTISVVGSGVEATAQRVTIATDSTGVLSVDDNGSTLSVDDGAGSLTVDNPTISVVGSGLEATAQRVTIATDSTGVLSVDDNGGNLSIDDGGNSITVDNPVLSVVGTGTEAAAQRVTIATDSTGVLSVDDNGGSLTVDAPVGTPAFVRLSDGAASLIGQKAMTASLPVVIASDQATFPVTATLGAGTAEVGKVQISDGTDVATVLPVRTVPATTEKGVNVNVLPSRANEYQVVTGEVAVPISIGVKELFNFFHPAAVTQDVYIMEIGASFVVTTASTTAGRTVCELFKSTAVGTGGTNVGAADVGGGLGTSGVQGNAAANLMQVKTGGGTLGVAVRRYHTILTPTSAVGVQQTIPMWQAATLADALVMRGGSADGINIQVNRVAAHTALVDQWVAYVKWIEL